MPEQKVEVVGNDGSKEKISIVEWAKVREEAGMARTAQWTGMWQESLRYFLSDQLSGQKVQRDWDWVVLNYIWPAIMQEIAKLSREYKIIATGVEQSDTESAEAWQGFLQWQWKNSLHQHGMRIEQLRAILQGKLYGYRISKLLWQPKAEWNDKTMPPQWDGEVRHRLWHPAQFWASDKEYVNDGDCGTVRWVDVEYAVSQWPAHEKELREASVTYPEMLKGGGDHVTGHSGTTGAYAAPGSTGTGDPARGTKPTNQNSLLNLVLQSDINIGTMEENADKRRYCKISEAYLKDYEEKPQSLEVPYKREELQASGTIGTDAAGKFIDQAGQPVTDENWPKYKIEWSQPTYPRGRVIIRCEDTLLNPKPEDQVYPHKTWPFIVIPHYLLPHMWQGSDAVSLYTGTQDMINVTVSHLVNNMKEFGNPRIAIEAGALQQEAGPGRSKKKYKIFAGAGAIIRLARGGLKKYKIEHPEAPSASATQLYSLFAQEYKNLVGLQDIATGKQGGKITATEAQFLAISSNDRIKLQNIMEESWVRRLARLMAEMDQHYYPVGRLLRVIGEDQVLGSQQIAEGHKSASMDIDVEPGQALPYEEEKQIAKYEKAYAMLQNPVANPMLPEMLRMLGIAGWQKLLDKYEAWQIYYQMLQLYEAVKKGEATPEQAVQLIVAKATEMYQAEQQNQIPQQQEAQ